LGAPLAWIAGQVNRAANGQSQPQPPNIDPYTGAPVYSGPLDVAPGSAPPPGYVNANGRLKPVPKRLRLVEAAVARPNQRPVAKGRPRRHGAAATAAARAACTTATAA
jgi:hypothetical protein